MVISRKSVILIKSIVSYISIQNISVHFLGLVFFFVFWGDLFLWFYKNKADVSRTGSF